MSQHHMRFPFVTARGRDDTRIACIASNRPKRLVADARSASKTAWGEDRTDRSCGNHVAHHGIFRIDSRHFSRLESSRMHIPARRCSFREHDNRRSAEIAQTDLRKSKLDETMIYGETQRTDRSRAIFRELIYFPLEKSVFHGKCGNTSARSARDQLTPRMMVPRPRILQPRFRECTFAQVVHSADAAALLCLRPERYLKIRIASCQSRGAEKSSSYASYVDI